MDGVRASIGSMNIDNRSFSLNHELDLTEPDSTIARRLEQVFADDLRYARPVTLEQWNRCGLGPLLELFVLTLRDQL